MINKTDLVEVIEGKYISSILEKNPEFSFGKIKYILDIYTRLIVNEVNLEDQQFAVSVLNPKNETGHRVRVFENGKAEGSYYKAEIESYNIF